ncbi:sigma-54-dependent transcriptional regulator [Pseudohongiella spirulinae]|uniref:Mutant NtrC activator n=1 Tax=Pseudohongiella spirulinae TaxID=1249552 RepID=A0A0S2KAI4_9GAMM|nr:sigma-54 dependent transcriptional regulator [Pseudohongiella spirulinae]ALO45141.1 Mutant NtrC activator [Pseudohongiella spirulinae]
MTALQKDQQDSILVVEDDTALRELLVDELTDAGYRVQSCDTVQSAIKILQQASIRLIISDLRLPGQSGLELLSFIRQRDQAPPGFIMITAFGTVEQAVDALKQGADDFLTKPIKLDHLRISAERVIQHRRLQDELAQYKAIMGDHEFHGMLGRSPVMQSLFNSIRMVARAEGPVLITGESGTGKELVARALHQESARKKSPFVAVNCAGLPPELLESELFGHTANAFTGAGKTRAGLFAEAHNGSLLLDEIGEMPLEMQAKLLRILQDGRIRPVGADQETQLNVRILAATNRNLEEDVRQGSFREDLYFRLQTFTIEVPALRQRGDDLDILIAHFIRRVNLQQKRQIAGISDAALQQMRQYTFPGNVRELSSAIERAVTFCQGEQLRIEDLPEKIRSGGLTARLPETGSELSATTENWPTLAQLELQHIQQTLKKFDGNKRQAAAALGIGRRTLYRKLGEEPGHSES